ncbi:MAG TPA: Rrf2 family transcriptional regulator [Longimicrobiales bacterium]|nr:Rrf2 family transcriptional regulator [Longimicrobiales bacterium]
MLSQSAAYALRAAVLLAREDPAGGPVPVGRIAEALEAPRNYLSKVLHVLAGSGVVSSKRGPGGGFVLAVPAAELALARVVAPFEPMDGRALCLLGRGRCSDEAPCEAHALWSPLAGEVRGFFERVTVADLLDPPPPV